MDQSLVVCRRIYGVSGILENRLKMSVPCAQCFEPVETLTTEYVKNDGYFGRRYFCSEECQEDYDEDNSQFGLGA